MTAEAYATMGTPRLEREEAGVAGQPGFHRPARCRAALLADLRAVLRERTGLDLSGQRWRDVAARVEILARDAGCRDPQELVDRLRTRTRGPRTLEAVSHHLTVGESFFFRDPAFLDALEQRVLAPLARAGRGRRLRIWSAGCSAGEEPYTIAMLLDRLVGHAGEPHATLLGSDISASALALAGRGLYRGWALRGTPRWARRRYFDRVGSDTWRLAARIRRRVSFAWLNLADEGYPSLDGNTNAVDLVLCRNVLMYMQVDAARAVVRRLHAALVEGGWLAVGLAEAGMPLFEDFERVSCDGITLYRRGQPAPRQRVSPAAEHLPVRICTSAGPSGRASPPTRRAGDVDDAPVQCATLMARTAREHADRGRLDAALEWIERAVAVDRIDPALHYLHALIERERGEPERALAALRCALYLDPDHLLSHYAAAAVARDLGRLGSARRHLLRVRDLLENLQRDAPVEGSDGLTAGRLMTIIEATGGDAAGLRASG